MKKYYVDLFKYIITTEKSDYAPPERYIEAIRGINSEIYTDTYYLINNKYLNFSWTDKSLKNINLDMNQIYNINLEAFFKSQNACEFYPTAVLIKRVYPPEIFDELLENKVEVMK